MAKKDASGAKKTEQELRAEGREAWRRIPKKERADMSPEKIAEIRHIPFNRFINAGKAPIILPKSPEEASRGPGRIEPGDIVEGDYYEQILTEARPMGFMRMCLVDDNRLDELSVKKAIRDGKELEPWQKEAKRKLIDGDGAAALPGDNPVENLHSVIGQQMPHASEKRT